jgi:hypothetical protein
VRNRFFERLAGKGHYAAFKDHCRLGGVPGIAAKHGIRCEVVRKIDGKSLVICDLSPSDGSTGIE